MHETTANVALKGVPGAGGVVKVPREDSSDLPSTVTE
jgi:hypothetical protein